MKSLNNDELLSEFLLTMLEGDNELKVDILSTQVINRFNQGDITLDDIMPVYEFVGSVLN